jgi:hypothetical protein
MNGQLVPGGVRAGQIPDLDRLRINGVGADHLRPDASSDGSVEGCLDPDEAYASFRGRGLPLGLCDRLRRARIAHAM